MNGVHDMGGMDGFGPIRREDNEPVFHADWERRVFALRLAMGGRRYYNVDEFRRTIERIPPARYLTASYYERWLDAIESLLIEKGILSGAELDAAIGAAEAQPAPIRASGAPNSVPAVDDAAARRKSRHGGTELRRDRSFKPRFKSRDRVIARNMNPAGHTRIPRYVRGRRGVIRHDWGVFVFPDTHAHGLGANPQHCYSVEFGASEVWGEGHSDRERILVDLWEDYLERDRSRAAAAKSRALPPKRTASSAVSKSTSASKSRSRR